MANHESMLDKPYHTLRMTVSQSGGSFDVELSTDDPQNAAHLSSVRRHATFDVQALLAAETEPEKYGQLLAEQLFADKDIVEEFKRATHAAQATNHDQRLTLCIDDSAYALQWLRWELLRHPMTEKPLGTSERVVFSRFLSSRDMRPVRLRAKTELTALIAVSAPPPATLEKMGLAPVDVEGELSRVKAAIASTNVRTIGQTGAPCTRDRLIEELRNGVDILYVVCHGTFGRKTRAPGLVLQNDAGDPVWVDGKDVATSIGQLQTVPRLVVLASCQSAGDGKQAEEKPVAASTPRTSVQATLATLLGDAGVPAIVAMQGNITMETVKKMMPVFFAELLKDGQIDRALAAARSVVKNHSDAWIPALFTRLKDGRLWYTPGFRAHNEQGVRVQDDREVWENLLVPIRDGRVVPILGPRLLAQIHGDAHDTALSLAIQYRFPFPIHEWDDLPRVTQYLSVAQSRYNVVSLHRQQLLADLITRHGHRLSADEIEQNDLHELLKLVGDRVRESNPTDPYNVLARLPASVYVTTNFDKLLEQALEAHGKTPQTVLTRWRYQAPPLPPPAQSDAEPTKKRPLVYHPFGAFEGGTGESLVLTEDDYFDYLIETSAAKLIPPNVESSLVSNSLLFLGFRLTDWHFRVLFRLMMSLPGRKELLKRYSHVAVQLDPDMYTMADVVEGKKYLAKYYNNEANIQIYWGSAEEFLKALHDELGPARASSIPPASFTPFQLRNGASRPFGL